MSTLQRLVTYFAVLILGIALTGVSLVWTVRQIEDFGLRIGVEGEQQ
jgi:hypothetical protein